MRKEIIEKVAKYIFSKIEDEASWNIPYHESEKWFGRISLNVDFSTGEFVSTTLRQGTYVTITEYIKRPENWEELIYRNIDHDILTYNKFYEMPELNAAIEKIADKYIEIFWK